jgi:hypothetical protein
MPSASTRPLPTSGRAMKDLMISPSIQDSRRIVLLTAGSYKSLGHVVDAVALP